MIRERVHYDENLSSQGSNSIIYLYEINNISIQYDKIKMRVKS